MDKRFDALLRQHGVHCYGVCLPADLPPLLPCRALARVPERARSVVAALFPYYTGPMEQRNVARYAALPDYHSVAGLVLEELAAALDVAHPGHQSAAFVDNSPIPEVEAARLAGLGVVGLHGQLINPDYGGHVFIGTVVTTLELPPSEPAEGRCLGCGRCVEACPTGALSLSGAFTLERCRSHITQKKGELSPWEGEQVRTGGLAWGCDICVDACPMNTWRRTPVAAFYDNPAPMVTLETLSALRREKPYGYRGRAVLERNLDLIRS